MNRCQFCQSAESNLIRIGNKLLICNKCSQNALREHFDDLKIVNCPGHQNTLICTICLSSADVIDISGEKPMEYCSNCGSNIDSDNLIILNQVKVSKFAKIKIESKKKEYFKERLNNFKNYSDDIREHFEDCKLRLKNDYWSLVKKLEVEYEKSLKVIEDEQEKAKNLLEFFINQSKMSLLKKKFEDITEGENFLFSNPRLDHLKRVLKLDLLYNTQQLRENLSNIFSISPVNFLSVFPNVLKTFIKNSNKFYLLTPDLVTCNMKNTLKDYTIKGGIWVEMPNQNIVMTELEHKQQLYIAVISEYSIVHLIEKMVYSNEKVKKSDYNNEDGCLAFRNNTIYYLAKFGQFFYNIEKIEKGSIARSPIIVSDSSWICIKDNILFSSVRDKYMYAYDTNLNSYSSLVELNDKEIKMLFFFEGQIYCICKNVLYWLENSRFVQVQKQLISFNSKIASVKVIDKCVYFITNDHILYRLSMHTKILVQLILTPS